MHRSLAALPAAVAAVLLLSCGGDEPGKPATKAAGASGAQPAAVKLARAAAGPNAKASSGVISAEADITIKGVPGFEEPFSSMVSGPFEYRKGAALPDYALELGVRDSGVTLTSVGGTSYVSAGSTAYELPAAVRGRLIRASRRGRNGLTRTLEQFGIAPWRWETEQRIAGTETIGGVATTHLATSFNAGRILRDVNTLLGLMRSLGLTRAVGLPPTIPARARRVFVKGVTTKVGGSWIGASDSVLRQSGFTMRWTVAPADRRKLSGITGGSVVAKVDVTDVGEPQTIQKPSDIGSYADFERAIDALGDAREGRG
jgi:hypothetical protein